MPVLDLWSMAFVFLLATAALLTLINLAIFRMIYEIGNELYADGGIDRMIISMFAAVVRD